MKKIALAMLASALLFSARADAEITEQEVRNAWRDVCIAAGMTELPLKIQQDDSPNAWVSSNEDVTVTTALMQILAREDEIFGVLAHECGHAYLRHIANQQKRNAGIGIAASLLSAVLDSSIADVALNVGANLAVAGYSREQEVEADDFAVDLAFVADRDPTGLYNALEHIIQVGGRTSPSGFNSHPPDERRLKHIEDRVHSHDPSIAVRKVLTGPAPAQTVDSGEGELSQGEKQYRSELDAEIEKWRREIQEKDAAEAAKQR